MIKSLVAPVLLSIVALATMWWWGGWVAASTALLLIILEVTLSFDNAVVNAGVLHHMPPVWQKRFLTWGIAISVLFTRAILPILIVAAAIGASPFFVMELASSDPAQYSRLLESASPAIFSFGGIFLVLVGLSYFINEKKHTHWLQFIERHVARWGRIEAIEIAIALIVLLGCALALEPAVRATVLIAGAIGIATFIMVRGVASAFEVEMHVPSEGAEPLPVDAHIHARAGFAFFIYLNVLDAAFSLDSVVGAFALTTSLPVIIVGLGIGAYAVRAFTLGMVHRGTLQKLLYIEHGAHWAILGLAVAMLASLFVHVPEPMTGFIGLLFLGLAYWSSVALRNVRG